MSLRHDIIICLRRSPLRFRSVMRKLSGQNAFDDTIFAPSFMLAKRIFNCIHTHTLAPINVSSIQTLVVKYFSPQRALYILNYIGLNQKSLFFKILHNVRSYTTIITVFDFLSTFLCHCNTFCINSALILPDGRLSVQMQSCWQIRPWRRQKHRHMSVTVSSIICYCTQCRMCV